MGEQRILVVGDDTPSFERLRGVLAEAMAGGTIRVLYALPPDEPKPQRCALRLPSRWRAWLNGV